MGTSFGMVDKTPEREVQKLEQSSFGTLTKYDVFLNHRGPDLKKTFVSHLHRALQRSGCEPFLDAKALVKGQNAFGSINEALSGVVVHVAIFSQGYAESKYCLNELCDMLASEKLIIPVLYDVEPENLRHTEVGPFAEAFRGHLKEGRDEDVVKWKAALLQVAEITAFKLVDCDNDAVKLVEKIVAAVSGALPTCPPLAAARHPVGLKESAENVMTLIHKMGESIGVIGICGMGGIGKTTLAREVYNREHANFGSCCFLSDVKEAKGVAVKDLQMQMVNDLLHVDTKKVQWNFGRWFDQIRRHRDKMLVVVDDITRRQQFDQLIPNLEELPRGSRVLITSRESGVLKNIMLDVAEKAVYHVPELSFPDSLELFLWSAFRRNSIDFVDASLHDFVERIVRACGGLPLALEVMGGFLSDKRELPTDEKYWEEATLALGRNGDINTSLQLSYDGLVEEEDKLMFVDIACFMVGQPERVALEVWDSSGVYGSSRWSLRRLMDKCLVKVDGRGQLSMHDLLRDMGRNVVLQRALQKPEMRSHIWDPLTAAKVLQKKQGSDEVLALSVIGEKSDVVCKSELYARMRELRYLFLDGCPVNGDFSKWSEELRWLQWRYFPHEDIPSDLSLPNLAVLDLAKSPAITHFWSRDEELGIPFKELRMLILSWCSELRELPQHINKLVKLKHVNLEGCGSLESLPDSLGELIKLEHLNLSNCNSLQSLPDSFGDLIKLEDLGLSRCYSLASLPDSLGNLTKLEHLNLSWCSSLKSVPNSLGLLFQLEHLNLSCSSLESLPESLGHLIQLEHLNLSWCSSLESVPDSLGDLIKLEHLNLSCCSSLKSLPQSLGHLIQLEYLNLSTCCSLESLPDSLGYLSKLKHLNISSCNSLQSLPNSLGHLINLEHLDLSWCDLQSLPDSLGDLIKLEHLNLDHCDGLTYLPESIAKLLKLTELRVSYVHMKKLPFEVGTLQGLAVFYAASTGLHELSESFGLLQGLKEVSLADCYLLRNLNDDFGDSGRLRKLDLGNCKSFTKLPQSFSNFSNLEELNLNGCELLRTLPSSVCGFKKLRIFRMGNTALEELPDDFGLLENLTEVSVNDCKQLQNLGKHFGCLRSLKTLDFGGCERLTKLPDSLSQYPNLDYLDMSHCKLDQKLLLFIGDLKELRILSMRSTALEELPESFGRLQSLAEVDFRNCKRLGALCENFGCLGSLRILNLDGCESLTTLPDSFINLSSLEELKLTGCKLDQKVPLFLSGLKKLKTLEIEQMALEELPENFTHLQSLETVNFGGCRQLHSLCENFGSLTNLWQLKLGSCSSLRELPDSFSNLSNLARLDLAGCVLLERLPPSVSSLKKLQALYMKSTLLEVLPENFGQLESLRTIDLRYCKQLQTLCESFGCLGELRKLDLGGCEHLTKLPDSFSDLSNLKWLDLSWCKVLRRLPSMSGLKELRVLRMGSSALEELSGDFGQLCSLEEVDFNDCKQLQHLCKNFGCLVRLRKLNLMFCERLRKLPHSFSDLTNLKELSLYGCKLLENLPPSVHGLKELRVLSMGRTALKELPEDFGRVETLTEVDFRSCKQLTALSEDFGCLGRLRKLNLDGCESLTTLPDSFSGLSKLKELSLYGCKQIEALPRSICRLKHLSVTHEEYGNRRSCRELLPVSQPEGSGG